MEATNTGEVSQNVQLTLTTPIYTFSVAFRIYIVGDRINFS